MIPATSGCLPLPLSAPTTLIDSPLVSPARLLGGLQLRVRRAKSGFNWPERVARETCEARQSLSEGELSPGSSPGFLLAPGSPGWVPVTRGWRRLHLAFGFHPDGRAFREAPQLCGEGEGARVAGRVTQGFQT